MRASYQGVGPYRGVVKDGNRVVATCDHLHRNRDASSYFGGLSARACATQLLMEIAPEDWEAQKPAWMRRS